MYVTVYLNEDEHAYVKAQGSGFLRRLVQEAIYEQGPADAPRTVEQAVPVQKKLNRALTREVLNAKGEPDPTATHQVVGTRCRECGSMLIARAKKCLVCGAKA